MVEEKRERLLKKESLDYHESLPHGKIKVVPTKPHATAHELSLAYSRVLPIRVLRLLRSQKLPTCILPKPI
jgi:malate dehydrogenase (oxaloacetate-decarboxylating)(NADP+)